MAKMEFLKRIKENKNKKQRAPCSKQQDYQSGGNHRALHTAMKQGENKSFYKVFHEYKIRIVTVKSFTSQKLYCRRFSSGPVFLNFIFDFSGIFQPLGVVTRAIHCYKKIKKDLLFNTIHLDDARLLYLLSVALVFG